MIGVTIALVEGVPIPEIASTSHVAKVYPVPAAVDVTDVTAPPLTITVTTALAPSPLMATEVYVLLV